MAAVTAGRQSWTNNGAYGSYVKSVMHHKDDEWDNDKDAWYRSENTTYGAFGSMPVASFKDIPGYRMNMKKTWEFNVAPTTYNELGHFYSHPKPTKQVASIQASIDGHSIDAAVQSDSADIHYSVDGKVSRSAQINEDELKYYEPVSSRQQVVKHQKHVKPPPASLPPVKVHPRHVENRMTNCSPLPDIPPHHHSFVIENNYENDEERAETPLPGILRRLDEREHTETAWHRYIEAKAHLIEEMKNKVVRGIRKAERLPNDEQLRYEDKDPMAEEMRNKEIRAGIRRAPSDEQLFVPSPQPPSECHETHRGHFETDEKPPVHATTKNYAQPPMDRVFVSDDHGGESKWVSQTDYNSTTSNNKHRPMAPNHHVPLYLETPWPMSMTTPIQTTTPGVGILPTGDNNNSLKYGRSRKGKHGVRVLYDYAGNKTTYVV